MKNIIKVKTSSIYKIDNPEYKISKKDFYSSNGELNLNALAWEAPSKIDGTSKYGYVPGDMFYDEICKELKSYKDVYRTEFIARKTIPDSNYDVIAEFEPETKMVSFYFIPFNTFEF